VAYNSEFYPVGEVGTNWSIAAGALGVLNDRAVVRDTCGLDGLKVFAICMHYLLARATTSV
jgi:hypothetical protein